MSQRRRASPSPSTYPSPSGSGASMERRIRSYFHDSPAPNSSSEPSFADCNRRKPGGILGASQHLGWEGEIAMAIKIDRIQPAGVNVRMQQGKPAYSHVVTVTGPAKMIYIAGQLARGADGNIVGPGDMRAQLEQIFKNLAAVIGVRGQSISASSAWRHHA